VRLHSVSPERKWTRAVRNGQQENRSGKGAVPSVQLYSQPWGCRFSVRCGSGATASSLTAAPAAGWPAAALSVFQTVRARLADELGIDAGPALMSAHRWLLAQPAAHPVRAGAGDRSHAAGRPIVGRAEEMAILRQAVRSARAGSSGLVVVEGEPGVGKTRLLEQIAAEAGSGGALVVWGRCVEGRLGARRAGAGRGPGSRPHFRALSLWCGVIAVPPVR